MAIAQLQPATGQTISGKVMLHEKDGQLMLHVMLAGLKPDSEHGFHVHEKGDCSKADFTSAGGHFNPASSKHGSHAGEHHAGDLPNLVADARGNVDQHIMAHGLTLHGSENGVIGRGFIVHANPDDYKSQPAGNSGARIACARIDQMGM
ncbi:superoxide dismutase family protein [Chitinilyticum piscinae]|nr:superoxide dismutase family protein [Chitinilyticum piscinae]